MTVLTYVGRGWIPTDKEEQEILTFLCGIIAEDSEHNTKNAQEMGPIQLLRKMLGPKRVTHSLKAETELSLKALSIKTLQSMNAYRRFKCQGLGVHLRQGQAEGGSGGRQRSEWEMEAQWHGGKEAGGRWRRKGG